MIGKTIAHKLNDFLQKIAVETNDAYCDIEIKGLSQNSALCHDDTLFIAVAGSRAHGIDFFKDAQKNGVKYCLTSKISDTYPRHSQIYVANLESRLIEICETFYQDIKLDKIVAVTGTNGKSSIIDFIFQLAKIIGFTANTLGTLGFKNSAGTTRNINLTSPDVFTFYHYLDLARADNINIFAFEASSHGLDQKRIGNVIVDCAIFTNLTHDHMDYHHDMESYYKAKKLLFSKHLSDRGFAIINVDDEYGLRLANEINKARVCRLSSKVNADISYNVISGNSFKLKIFEQEVVIKHGFVAEFQIVNYVSAIAYFVLNHEIELKQFESLANKLNAVKGRMQAFPIDSIKAKVIIDFAHTPDAMANVLKSLRGHTEGRLIALFGCGGDRDKTKRPIMGNIAEQYADIVIVTDDNPRSESPEAIRAEIIAGHDDFIEIGDRHDAILFALASLKLGDILVILGKGHEEYQIINNHKKHFSEQEIITEFIEANYGNN